MGVISPEERDRRYALEYAGDYFFQAARCARKKDVEGAAAAGREAMKRLEKARPDDRQLSIPEE